VALGQRDDYRLGAEQVDGEITDQRRAAERDIEGAAAHAGDERADRQVGGMQPGMRVTVAEQPHDRRHHLVGHRGQEAGAQVEILAGGTAPDGVHHPLGCLEQRPGLAQQHLADGGERDPAAGALQQRRPGPRLKPAELHR
jgi:hypothetical protein